MTIDKMLTVASCLLGILGPAICFAIIVIVIVQYGERIINDMLRFAQGYCNCEVCCPRHED